MSESAVAEFFASLGPFRDRKKSAHYTHRYNGARYVVEADRREQLSRALQTDLQDLVPYAVEEVLGPTFRLFFRFVFAARRRLDDATVGTLAHVVHSTAVRFFADEVRQRIPTFFEQVWLEAQGARAFATRSELVKLAEKQPLLADDAVIKIADASIQMLDGSRFVPIWIALPTADGMYKVTCDGAEVALAPVATSTAPRARCVNPLVHTPRCAEMLEHGPVPAGALLYEDEVAALQTCRAPTPYTSSTVIALGGDEFIRNTRREAGRVAHELYVVMPEVTVTLEQALCMREALIAHLERALGADDDLAPTGWRAVVDLSCYNNGVRIFGSERREDCSCGSKRGCHRPTCRGGQVLAGERMELRAVFVDGVDEPARTAHYLQNAGRVLRRTALAPVGQPVAEWARYVGCPQHTQELKTVELATGQKVVRIESRGGRAATGFKTDRAIKPRRGGAVVTEPAVVATLQDLIRERFTRAFAGLCVTDVYRSDDEEALFVHVAGEGQHWCLNLNPPGDHDSNTIYFQCTRQGICQRCRCPSASCEGRRNGPCKLYKSRTVSLSKPQRLTLFPTAAPPAPVRGQKRLR
jgi:hypothetical protein